MNTVGFTPSYATNVKSCNTNRNVNFKGAIGDKLVREMVDEGKKVDTAKVMDAVKGTFGPKSEKVADVVDSFTSKISSLLYENKNQQATISEQSKKIAEFPREKESAVEDAYAKMRKSAQEELAKKDSVIADKDAQIAELKKYEDMAKVKSVEEVGVVMPDVAVKTLDDMMANRADATESMFNFLMTGKGQEKALEQIDRNNTMMKAHMDKITEIDEVKDKAKIAQEQGIFFSKPETFAIDMIGQALKGNKKGQYIESPAIEKQVKSNAMALLSPMADERYSNTGRKYIESQLDATFKDVKEYHKGLEKGKKHIIDNNKNGDGIKIIDEQVPYSTRLSKIKIVNAESGKPIMDYNYDWVASIGNNH